MNQDDFIYIQVTLGIFKNDSYKKIKKIKMIATCLYFFKPLILIWLKYKKVHILSVDNLMSWE